MKIAVVGAGISGLVCASLLHRDHEITVFEAADWIGGHTHTVTVRVDERDYDIDTGFIVFNRKTYPNFIRLLERWGVESQPTRMSFSVRDESRDFEYQGYNLDTIFAQRRNLFRPSFLGMLRDITRFNRDAKRWLRRDEETTLGAFLDAGRYGEAFVRDYLLPMGSAVWSSTPAALRDFPARFFLGFFENHGFLEIDDRPEWRVIKGGSARYVEAAVAPFRDRIRTRTPVRSIHRESGGAVIRTDAGDERFDAVIVALHADGALAALADPTETERALLSSFAYQPSDVVLHTDARLLPKRKRAWAAWNYHLIPAARERVMVTYNMNILQSIESARTFCVSLNRTDAIDPETVLGRWCKDHPAYSAASAAAQARHEEVLGPNHTYFCGAYWGYGFHEDGVRSALAVCRRFGTDLDA